jgi:hypothetical protein
MFLEELLALLMETDYGEIDAIPNISNTTNLGKLK